MTAAWLKAIFFNCDPVVTSRSFLETVPWDVVCGLRDGACGELLAQSILLLINHNIFPGHHRWKYKAGSLKAGTSIIKWR